MLRGMAESKKVRAAEWAKRVERWKRSGLSAEEFSAREGLRAARLSWWRWYLSRKEPHRDVAAPSKPQFVPARVVERGDTKPVSSCLEVVLANGRVVRISGAVEPKLLMEAIRVLEAAG